MTRSIRGRRGRILLAGAAVAAALLGSGCGAGQIAETAEADPGVPGITATTSDGRFKVVNLAIEYPGLEGYPAGADAPLNVAIYNDSLEPAIVQVSTTGARAVVLSGEPSPGAPATTPTAPAASPTGTPGTADPTGSPGATGSPGPTPGPTGLVAPTTAVPTGPARVEVPAAGVVLLNGVTAGPRLRLIGLNQALATGDGVTVVFDFGDQQLELLARVAVPRDPAPRQELSDGAGHG